MQLQEWITERNARDKIESDLRDQLAKYGEVVAANDLKCAHFDSQMRDAMEKLAISERRSEVLLEKNRTHVVEFERYRSQVEAQRPKITRTEPIADATGGDGDGDGRSLAVTAVRPDSHGGENTPEWRREMELNEALQTEVCSGTVIN